MSQNKEAAGEEQPGDGRSECEVPCVGSLFGDHPKHQAAGRWRWWWCPIHEYSDEKEDTNKEVTRKAKRRNVNELKLAGRKQKREEKMQKKPIKMTEITDKTNTKLAKKEANLQKRKKENNKVSTKIKKGQVELTNIKTGLEKATTNIKYYMAKVPAKKAAKRLSNAKRARRLKKDMASSTFQTQGSEQDSFLLPLSTKETGFRGLFTMRVAVAVLLLLHMILVQVFGYLMFCV